MKIIPINSLTVFVNCLSVYIGHCFCRKINNRIDNLGVKKGVFVGVYDSFEKILL